MDREIRTPAVPPPQIAAHVEQALGAKPIQWWRPHTGLSPAERLIVRLDDGSSAFVKAAVDDETEAELRVEHEILAGGRGDFLPRLVAWVDSGSRPVLITEDLSGAHWPADHWPVTWQPGQFDTLFATLERVAATPAPASLAGAESGFVPRWPAIARDADRFLALGLCSDAWLRSALDALIEAERSVPLAGDALVHNDVRSDNLCFIGTRMVLVDWGSALRGNRHHDLAAALTTLPLESGPDPFDVFPDGGAWASYHAARSARRAAYGRRANMPQWLQIVFARLTAISLDWAARSLALPAPDGKRWTAIQ